MGAWGHWHTWRLSSSCMHHDSCTPAHTIPKGCCCLVVLRDTNHTQRTHSLSAVSREGTPSRPSSVLAFCIHSQAVPMMPQKHTPVTASQNWVLFVLHDNSLCLKLNLVAAIVHTCSNASICNHLLLVTSAWFGITITHAPRADPLQHGPECIRHCKQP